MSEPIRIRRGTPKGEDGYKTFSIRVKEEIITALDEIARESDLTRNALIGQLLEQCVKNYEIVD